MRTLKTLCITRLSHTLFPHLFLVPYYHTTPELFHKNGISSICKHLCFVEVKTPDLCRNWRSVFEIWNVLMWTWPTKSHEDKVHSFGETRPSRYSIPWNIHNDYNRWPCQRRCPCCWMGMPFRPSDSTIISSWNQKRARLTVRFCEFPLYDLI